MAGRIYEEEGKIQQAVDTYIEGQEFMAAAFALEKMPGKADRAADMFLKAGDYKKAAEIWAQNGKRGQGGAPVRAEGQQPRGRAALRAGREVGQGGRAVREERVPAEGGGGLREAGRPEARPPSPSRSTSWRTSPSRPRYSGRGARQRDEERAAGGPALRAGRRSREGAARSICAASFFKEAAAVSARHGPVRQGRRVLPARGGPGRARRTRSRRAATRSRPRNYRGEVAFKAGRLAEAAALLPRRARTTSARRSCSSRSGC